jgi:hypothetical protein
MESMEAFIVSPELVYLLAACLKCLESSPKLRRLEAREHQPSMRALLNSLEYVDFPRNLVKLKLTPDVFLKDDLSLLSNTLCTHTKYISRLHVHIIISRWSETPGEVADSSAISNILSTAENTTHLSFRATWQLYR